MRTIWRIQNSQGVGPYHGIGHSDWKAREHSILTGHPDPYEDLGIASFWRSLGAVEMRDWKFGFQSLEQLERWFCKEELQCLANYGFIPVEVEASHVVSGTHQVIFLPKEHPVQLQLFEEVDCEYKISPI